MSRFRIASTVVIRGDEKAGFRGDALGSQVIDALTRSVTPRSEKRSSSLADEYRLAVGNEHYTAFATVGSAGIIFRSTTFWVESTERGWPAGRQFAALLRFGGAIGSDW
jgi:hypothetical protein